MAGKTGVATGGQAGLGVAEVYRPEDMVHTHKPGAFVSPTQWLIVENPGAVKETVHTDQRKAARFDANVLARPALLKSDLGGPTNLGLYASNGKQFLDFSLGSKTPLSATVSDTIASIADVGNTTEITLTTGTAAFLAGAPLKVTSGEGEVATQIFSWDSGAKKLVVPLLDPDEDFGFDAGDTVVQLACDKLRRFTLGEGFLNLGPIFCMERVMPHQQSLQFRRGIINTWKLTASGGKFNVVVDTRFSGKAPTPVDPSEAWDPTEASVSDSPISVASCVFGFPNDQAGAGTFTLQRMDDVVDWDLEINRMAKAYPINNQKDTNQFEWTGCEIALTITKMLDRAPYPQMFFNAVRAGPDRTPTPIPVFIQIIRNVGTVGSPSYKGYLFYLANVIFGEGQSNEPLEDIVEEGGLKGMAHVIGAQPDLIAYVL